MAEFDIKELVAKAHFDYVGPSFPEWWENNKTKMVLPSLTEIGVGLLDGQKYFQTLKLSYNGTQFVFPNEPLISLSLTKTIVETPTVGKERKGTVKEYICTEDYNLTINGLCVYLDEEKKGMYPAEQVQEVQNMFEINDSLEVVSNPFLELFGIRNLVLKEIQWEAMQGQESLQKYSITAISDQDFYADLLDREKQLP